MAIEEKVVQPESVTPADQPVADTPSQPQPQAPNLDAVKADYEAKLAAAQKEAAEAQEKFQGIKGKLDEVYKQKEEKRTKELEDQGQYKTLWEEANKTAQDKDAQINNLSQQLQDMKTSNEVASTKQTALAAISNLGAINAEQTLSLLQKKLQKAFNLSAEYVGIEPPEVKISRDFDIERLIGQDITALTSLFDQQVINREEFRDILVQGEVLSNPNEVKPE